MGHTMKMLRNFDRKYGDLWKVLLCSVIYLIWFFALEHTVTIRYHVIHVRPDDWIPFCEYFIVPYLLWFLYVPLFCVWFYRKDRALFRKLICFLFIGMFASLLFCTVYPNGTDFRPAVSPDKNVFSALVAWLYGTDTPTNVLPSIHVYNSLGIHIAVCQEPTFRKKKALRGFSFCLCTAICLATMFLKQHSVVDVLSACFMAYAVYGAVYAPAQGETSGAESQRRLLLEAHGGFHTDKF